MATNFSVTTLLKKLPDASAAQGLYRRFVEQVALARHKLGAMPRRALDEEDIAQVVFEAFFRGVAQGRFLDLHDRHDLWQVLFMLTERKANDAKRKHFSRKRGAGRVTGESAVNLFGDSQARNPGLAGFAHREPTPEFAAAAAEELQRLLNLLPNELRQICLWKMEGRTNEEIAAKIGRVTRTVENKLRLIRKFWTEK